VRTLGESLQAWWLGLSRDRPRLLRFACHFGGWVRSRSFHSSRSPPPSWRQVLFGSECATAASFAERRIKVSVDLAQSADRLVRSSSLWCRVGRSLGSFDESCIVVRRVRLLGLSVHRVDFFGGRACPAS